MKCTGVDVSLITIVGRRQQKSKATRGQERGRHKSASCSKKDALLDILHEYTHPDAVPNDVDRITCSASTGFGTIFEEYERVRDPSTVRGADGKRVL